jgi:hypothetical protein
MSFFLYQKVTGAERSKNPKSHGTILDNIAYYWNNRIRYMETYMGAYEALKYA